MTVVRETFHAQISQNKRRSILLVVIIAAILGVLGWFMGYYFAGDPAGAFLFVPLALGLAGLLSAGAYFSGDSLVLAASAAHEVTEREQPQLLNVVREMSLAANVPLPRVYLIDDTAPNAFATGRDPEHASVAITTGLLQKLDREELQGVIGHEMAHVRNYDIRFSLLVGVLVGSIALLADMLARMAFWGGMTGRGSRRGRDGDSGGAGVFIFFLGLLVAILAPFFASLVQMAVNRQREYLADATSVELTRNPYGLERALAKLATDQEPLEVANRATQHLYIVNPIKKLDESARGLFSTHPAIVDRINRLRRLTGEPDLDANSMRALAGLD
jgi:heat shock protein HtpX